MSIVITLISGKGGSGKTTIGLAIAKLLSKCEKKILFIDCDISTHGATYFFESSLTNDLIDNISSTKDFLESQIDRLHPKAINPIKGTNGIDFIPSVKKIMGDDNNLDIGCSYTYQSIKTDKFINEYDLIILDCQAGYTKLTKELISISDICLFVLEADSVSASAMRALYTQLSSVLSRSSLKSYQIFNKLRDDEAIVYSDIKYGTFFTNLKPILFDWSVRNSFQENMIPLISEKNPSFTTDICRLTRNLFPIFQQEILNYEIKTKHLQIDEEIEHLKRIKRKSNPSFAMLSLLLIMLILLVITILITFKDLFTEFLKQDHVDQLAISLGMLAITSLIATVFYEKLRPKEIKIELAKTDEINLKIKSMKQEIELLEENKKNGTKLSDKCSHIPVQLTSEQKVESSDSKIKSESEEFV